MNDQFASTKIQTNEDKKLTRQKSIDSILANNLDNFSRENSYNFNIGNKSHIGFHTMTNEEFFKDKRFPETEHTNYTNILLPTIEKIHISEKEFHSNTSIEKNTKEIHYIETQRDSGYTPINYGTTIKPLDIMIESPKAPSNDNLKTIMSEVIIKSATNKDDESLATIKKPEQTIDDKDLTTYNLKNILLDVLNSADKEERAKPADPPSIRDLIPIIKTTDPIIDYKSYRRPSVELLNPASTTPVVVKQTEPRIIGEDHKYGYIKLSLHYDELRSRLSLTVHEAQ